MKKQMILCCVLLFLWMLPAAAADQTDAQLQDVIDSQFEAAGGYTIDQTLSGRQEFDPSFSFAGASMDFASGQSPDAGNILKTIFSLFFSETRAHIADAGKIILVVVLLAFIGKFAPEKEKVFDSAFYVSYVVLFILLFSSFRSVADIGRETIENLCVFIDTCLPVMSSLAISANEVSKTAAAAAGTMGIFAVANTISQLLLPIGFMLAGIAAVNHLSDDFSLQPLYDCVKKAVLWGLGIIMTVFSAVLMMSGVTGNALDNVGGKAVKYAVGNFIPFVGGVLSDSLESIIVYGKLIKTAAGTAGILALLYICLAPAIKMIAIIFAYKLCSVVLLPVADKRITGALDDVTGVMSMILAMVLCCAALFIIAMGLLANML